MGTKYYNIDKILKTKANYNFIIGNCVGKTTAILNHMYKQFKKHNAVNYYVHDNSRAHKYLQYVLETENITDTCYKKDGIHYKLHGFETDNPFIYTPKFHDGLTWRRDKCTPLNVVFDEVSFDKIDDIQLLIDFLFFVRASMNTKVWIIGDFRKPYYDFLRQFLIKDVPTKAGLYTYDVYDVKIAVEINNEW